MILTTEQIKDYQYCPMMYYYNHVAKVMPTKNSQIEKFAFHSLKQTYYWYFYELQDNNTPTLKGLREKFGDLYIKDRTYLETMLLDTKGKARVLENRCVKAISNFFNIFEQDRGVPLLVNKHYELKFDDVILKGTIPVIRETKFKDIQLISFAPDVLVGNRKDANYQIEVERDIDIIASSIAFSQLYGWNVDLNNAYGTHFHNIYSCKVNGAIKHNLEKIVKQVAHAISNNIFYPIYNTRCSTCAYKNTCLKEW